MSKSHSSDIEQPWYRQFWPWFLIAVPVLSMISGLIMIVLSLSNADQLVVDDYYKQGLAINENLALDHYASERGLGATVRFDLETGEVFVESLQGDYTWPRALQLKLLHPMAAELDQTLALRSFTGGYRADLESVPHSRYYLHLSPLDSTDGAELWRLSGELDFRHQSSKVLQAK